MKYISITIVCISLICIASCGLNSSIVGTGETDTSNNDPSGPPPPGTGDAVNATWLIQGSRPVRLPTDTIVFEVNLSEAVMVIGIPSISFQLGNSLRSTTQVSGSGSSQLLFQYTVLDNDPSHSELVFTDGINLTSNADIQKVSDGSSVAITLPSMPSQNKVITVNPDPKIMHYALATGSPGYCGILSNEEVKCWGSQLSGFLGNETGGVFGPPFENHGDSLSEVGDTIPNVDLGNGPNKPIKLDSEGATSCVLFENGRVKCWGENGGGSVGIGNTNDRGDEPNEMGSDLPYIDLGTNITAKNIYVTGRHNCALTNQDQLKCWGFWQNPAFRVGDEPDEMGDNLPNLYFGAGRSVKSADVGDFMGCAILDNNTTRCWTSIDPQQYTVNNTQILGDQVFFGTGRHAEQVSTNPNGGCALLDNGTVKCWGLNNRGQLGYDSSNEVDMPTSASMGNALNPVNLGIGRTALSIHMGAALHTCSVLDNYRVKCWGYNNLGQLGQGNTENIGDSSGDMAQLSSIDIAGSDDRVISVMPNGLRTCAILPDLSFKCWGTGVFGTGTSTGGNPGSSSNSMGNNLPIIPLGTNKTLTIPEN